MAGIMVLLFFEFFAMAVFVACLHRYYRSPLVGKDANISTYAAWTFGFSGIILLPFGISLLIAEYPDFSFVVLITFVCL